MKALISILWLSVVILFGCDTNPNDTNEDSILVESKTISKNFNFYRNIPINYDTLTFSVETSIPDVYIIAGFYLTQRKINSYDYSILQIDTPAVSNVNFSVNVNYSEISWTTLFETNNQGWEIQKKDSNQTYNTIGFVPGSGTTTETHQYYYRHNSDISKTFFYRLKQIDFDGSFTYSVEAQINVDAIDSIGTKFSINAENGVIIFDGEIAPDSGYTSNLNFNLGDLIYFRNSLFHYGKIKLHHFSFVGESF